MFRSFSLSLLLVSTAFGGDRLPEGTIARLGEPSMSHSGRVSAVAFSPDGKLIVSASRDGTIRFWSLATREESHRCLNPRGVASSLSFSPDGKHLIAVSENAIELWEVSTGKRRLRVGGARDDAFSPAAFSPDGRSFAAADQEGVINLWETEGGKLLHRLPARSRPFIALAFTSDGSRLRGYSSDDILHEWDIATRKQTQRYALRLDPNDGPRRAVLASNDLLFFSGNGEYPAVQVRDIPRDALLRGIHGHKGRAIARLAVSPDGKRYATAGNDGRVAVWDATTGKWLWSQETDPKGVGDLAFSADGKWLAVGCDSGSVRTWDAETASDAPQPIAVPTGITALDYSPDGGLLGAGTSGGAIQLWDIAARKRLHILSGHGQTITALRFSPDGKVLASGSTDLTARLWDVESGKELLRLDDHRGPVVLLTFSHDAKLLFTATRARKPVTSAWNVTTGKAAFPPLASQPDAVRMMPGQPWPVLSAHAYDGRSVATWEPERRDIVVIETLSARPRSFLLRAASALHCLAISPDGRLLAMAGEYLRPIVWNVLEQKSRFEMADVEAKTWSVAFSPDGKRLAMGRSDSTILLLNASKWYSASPRGMKLADRASEWQAFAGEAAEEAFRSLWELVALGPEVVPTLLEQVRQLRPADEQRVLKRVMELDNDRFKVREEAEAELMRVGIEAIPALEAALEGKPTLEQRRRIERVLALVKGRGIVPARVMAGRCIEALERIGTTEAKKALEELARSEQEFVRRDAAAALQRLR
jgi:WD40 repeat protein